MPWSLTLWTLSCLEWQDLKKERQGPLSNCRQKLRELFSKGIFFFFYTWRTSYVVQRVKHKMPIGSWGGKYSFHSCKGSMGLQQSERLKEAWYHLVTRGIWCESARKGILGRETTFPRKAVIAEQWHKAIPGGLAGRGYLSGCWSKSTWGA